MKRFWGMLFLFSIFLFSLFPLFAENLEDGEILSLIEQLTLEEKVGLVHAASIFQNGAVDRLGIPPLNMSDGPHGVRWETGSNWIMKPFAHNAVTSFPPLSALSATWNRDLASRFGTALGKEFYSRGKDIALGPGINLMRTPLNGRNFEYMGEDPYLAGQLAVAEVKALQKEGVAACVKHFAANNQEHQRLSVNVEMEERVLRELYLYAFEQVVKEGGVLAIMPAYNRFRSFHCAESDYLLDQILRKEWGFQGVALSDWGAVHSTLAASKIPLDLEMGTFTHAGSWNSYHLADSYLRGLKEGRYEVADLNRKVYHLLYLMKKLALIGRVGSRASSDQFINQKEHQEVALSIAQESIVLLKNDNQRLPLPQKDFTLLVVGDSATREYSNSGGSSNVLAQFEITLLAGLKKEAERYPHVTIDYEKGYVGDLSPLALGNIVKKAKKADAVLLCLGTQHRFNRYGEVEGRDRGDFNLPPAQLMVLRRLLAVRPDLIVSITAGTPVGLAGMDNKIQTLLYNWYNGMYAGTAFAQVLFGQINPSGRLPFSIAKQLSDYPSHTNLLSYPGIDKKVCYTEGLDLGYRYFDKNPQNLLFPFGFGLSYTSFSYSDLQIDLKEKKVRLAFTVMNNGDREGKTTAQIYVGEKNPKVARPIKELKGFTKIDLKPHQSKRVTVDLDQDAFAYYDFQHGWVAQPGLFEFYVGQSAFKPELQTVFFIKDFSLIAKGLH